MVVRVIDEVETTIPDIGDGWPDSGNCTVTVVHEKKRPGVVAAAVAQLKGGSLPDPLWRPHGFDVFRLRPPEFEGGSRKLLKQLAAYCRSTNCKYGTLMDGVFAISVKFTDFDTSRTPADNMAPDATGKTVSIAIRDLQNDSPDLILCTLLGFEQDAAEDKGFILVCTYSL